jgi:mRNA-degrading endonuclease YafQ of YafQ-DinJ toxin-antitoxin module
MPDGYTSLEFTEEFVNDLTRKRWQSAELAAVIKCLRLLDEDDRHPSLRIHALVGDQDGIWTAYVNRSIRLTFERLAGGRRRVLSLSRHYDD